MIKLKSLLKEGIYGKFWWMTPEGGCIPVLKPDPYTGHNDAAIEILENLGHEPEKNVYQQLYDLGWIRVEYGGHQGTYTLGFNTGGNQPNRKQLEALKDLATELNADEIFHISLKQRIPFGIW